MLTRLDFFFSIPGKEFLDFRELRVTCRQTIGLLWAGLLSPVAPSLLSVNRLLLHGGHGPHTRCMDADTAKQRTVAYLSGKGRGNRCFGRHGLIAIVTSLSRTGSARTAASICLYSVYRKQERSLFTDALEQTSNVPTTHNVSRSSGRVWRRACGLPYPVSGRRSRPSVALHVCFLASAPRRRRPGRCPPFHAPIPPATSTDCPAVIPWPVVRGPMAVALSRSRPRPFWAHHCELRRLSAGGDGVPLSAGDGARSGQWSPLPPSHPRRRSNSDHAGESTYSGRNRESRSRPGNSISRELKSLLNCITIMFLSVL